MGKPILYCGDCGRSLREEDFERRKAGYLGNLPYCLACRPDAGVPETRPAPSAGSTARLRSLPGSAPSRTLFARPSSRVPVGVVAAVGGAVVLLGLLFAASSTPKPPPPAPKPVVLGVEPLPASAAPQPRPEAPPPARPEPPRPAPAPAEPELLSPRQDVAAVLDRFLDDIRAIRASDEGFRRAEEVRSMLRRAVEIAGPRKGEVEVLLAGYEKEIAAAAAPKVAPPVVRAAAKPAPASTAPPPSGAKITGFTLINADTEKPVSGYDPIPSDTTLDLEKLGLKRIDFRINTSPSNVGHVTTVIGTKSRVEQSPPYSFTTNSVAGGFTGWTPEPGRHTLRCRLGQTGTWVTFCFTIADLR